MDFEVRNNLSERDKLERSLKGLELTLLSAKHEAIKQVLYDIYEQSLEIMEYTDEIAEMSP